MPSRLRLAVNVLFIARPQTPLEVIFYFNARLILGFQSVKTRPDSLECSVLETDSLGVEVFGKSLV